MTRRGADWRRDPMNATTKVRRNKLRHLVIPALEQIETAAINVLGSSAGRCRDDADLLDEYVRTDFEAARAAVTSNAVLLRLDVLRRWSERRVAAVLRHAWQARRAPGMTLPPAGAVLDDLARAVAAGTTEHRAFGPVQDFAAEMARGWLLLHAATTGRANAWAECLEKVTPMIFLPEDRAEIAVLNSSQRYTPGHYDVPLPAGARLLIDVFEKNAQPVDLDSDDVRAARVAYVDARTIRRDLFLQPVDPVIEVPVGGGMKKSIATLLAESHVPPAAAPRLAMLVDERGPLWIPGVRRVATGYVTARTELVVKLTLVNGEA